MIIVLAVIALVIWLLIANTSESPSWPGKTTATQTTPELAPPPRTTVFTPPPAQRPTVTVEQLRVGDCVEVQQTQPDPSKGPDTNDILIFPVRCEVRDGVFRVDQILSTRFMPGAGIVRQTRNDFCLHLELSRLIMRRLCSLIGDRRATPREACGSLAECPTPRIVPGC